MQEIAIRHGSRMANRMLQYLTAIGLSGPETRISGYDIAEWGMAGPKPGGGHRAWPKVDVQRVDAQWLRGLLADGRLTRLKLTEAVCDVDLLPDRTTANAAFYAGDQDIHPLTDRDLLIHVRLEDIMVPGRHTGYGPLPLNWYQQIIDETGLHPVFIGQLGDDPYSDAIRARFPGATLLEGGTVLHDFQTLRAAPNVALGVSTFSWLAAWLGQADRVFYPLLGILNPSQAPGINLTPASDPRYEFWHFPPRQWMADGPAIEAVTQGPHGATRLEESQVATLLTNARAAADPAISEWRARVEAAR